MTYDKIRALREKKKAKKAAINDARYADLQAEHHAGGGPPRTTTITTTQRRDNANGEARRSRRGAGAEARTGRPRRRSSSSVSSSLRRIETEEMEAPPSYEEVVRGRAQARGEAGVESRGGGT
ncbi:MAG: hypothetical protein M1833_001992 [Piccolia ochrophora]|nr:MAG: hypothetical protein M1833_001992 [Piccolia ochrophora]